LVVTKTVVHIIAMSILALAPAVTLAQPIPTQTVTSPIIIGSYTIPPVNNLLTTPGAKSDDCENWTNTEVDDDSRIVTSQRQCHTEGEQFHSEQFHSEQFHSQPTQTNPLLTNLLSNQQ
jgi:hypothetical protein